MIFARAPTAGAVPQAAAGTGMTAGVLTRSVATRLPVVVLVLGDDLDTARRRAGGRRRSGARAAVVRRLRKRT